MDEIVISALVGAIKFPQRRPVNADTNFLADTRDILFGKWLPVRGRGGDARSG